MNFLKIWDYILLFLLSVLLIIDYLFTTVVIAPKILLITLIALIVISDVIFKKNKSEVSLKKRLFQDIIFTAYLVLLIGLLTIIGGNSNTGISFSNVYFWIVIGIWIIKLLIQFNKIAK